MPELFADVQVEQIGVDLSKVVDRVSKQYDDPEIAFQKEAIQNSWDVRKDKKTGKDWVVKIDEYVDDNNFSHIVIEDYGTIGMDQERWDGFSSLWKPFPPLRPTPSASPGSP